VRASLAAPRSHSPSENHLIAAVPDAELAPVVDSMERVSMRLGGMRRALLR
jgi:hypothetical protein